MIKDLNQMNVAQSWYIRWGGIIFVILTLCLFLGLYYWGTGIRTQVLDIVDAVGLVVVVVMTVYLGVSLAGVGEKTEAAYLDYLESIDFSVLKKASTSPELSKRSRELIVTYLNNNHPGWSFENTQRS